MINHARMPATFPPSVFLVNPIPSIRVILALLVGLALFSPASGSAQPSSPLQLTVVRTSDASEQPVFSVELHNTGEHDVILNLGIMLANGKKQYADCVQLLLEEHDGTVLHLKMRGPGIVAGRLDPMVVPLPKGATFSFRADLNDYFAPDEKVWELNLHPGEYTLSAEYIGVAVPRKPINPDMQGVALMHFWIGTAHSNTLPFTLTGEFRTSQQDRSQ